MVVLKDFRGTPILVDSQVVYPVRQTSSMWMCEMTVTKVTDDPPRVYGFGADGKQRCLRNLRNVVVVK